jgi:hypothetical protein
MSHGIYRVTAFEKVSSHTLKVSFDHGLSRTIDFEPLLKGELYGPLRDESVFDSVTIDPEVHTLVWSNGADFDPQTLHDWPEAAEELASMAQRWTEATGGSRD